MHLLAATAIIAGAMQLIAGAPVDNERRAAGPVDTKDCPPGGILYSFSLKPLERGSNETVSERQDKFYQYLIDEHIPAHVVLGYPDLPDVDLGFDCHSHAEKAKKMPDVVSANPYFYPGVDPKPSA